MELYPSSSNYGLINNLLAKVGLPTFNFFTSQNALYSFCSRRSGSNRLAMVIFLANLQSISGDLYEAAEIDGASGFTRFFRITLPLMCPRSKS
ncbi:MAG: carbohydrate ABC transporter permease [Merdibacter sp.]